LLSALANKGLSQKIISDNQKVFVYFYGDIRTLPNGTITFHKSITAVFRQQTQTINGSKISFIKLL
jgi:hypothetical protein